MTAPGAGWKILVVGLLTAFALYFLLPVYWLVIAATKSTGDLFGTFGLWFADFRLVDNLTGVLTYDDGIYLRVMLSDPKLYPITLGLTSWQSFADRQPELYQLTVGGAFLSVLPLMAAIVVLQRFWRGGLTEGSLKG